MTEGPYEIPLTEVEFLRQLHSLQARADQNASAITEMVTVYKAEAEIQTAQAVDKRAGELDKRVLKLLSRGLIALTIYTAVLVYGTSWMVLRIGLDCLTTRESHWYCHVYPGTLIERNEPR